MDAGSIPAWSTVIRAFRTVFQETSNTVLFFIEY